MANQLRIISQKKKKQTKSIVTKFQSHNDKFCLFGCRLNRESPSTVTMLSVAAKFESDLQPLSHNFYLALKQRAFHKSFLNPDFLKSLGNWENI